MRKTVVMIKMNRMVRNSQMMHFQLTMGRVARTGRLTRRQIIMANFKYGMISLATVQTRLRMI